MNIFFVGAGLWSSVLAERITSVYKLPVTIFERRPHCGGNCYSSLDEESGIECHRYGTHIFHTASEKVWKYISQFTEFTPYRHKVLTVHKGMVYPMPMNLGTINQFYGKALCPSEAKAFLQSEIRRESISHPANLEEKAISLIGRPLYEAFIKGYTHKQWEHDPKDLPAEIITRLPVRFTYNTDYFNDYWQGMPLHGYGAMFGKLLANPLISIEYNRDFEEVRSQLSLDSLLIYTGLPDQFFNYKYGELEWRSLQFEWEYLPIQDFQGTSVMNYADISIPYTRIHEFKHLHAERKEVFARHSTIICREYSQVWHRGSEAYYPITNLQNKEVYMLYKNEADTIPNLILGGRLGKYSYFDMDTCIGDALNFFEQDVVKYFDKN